jgi:hypothetical protein
VSFPASGGPRETLTANRTYYVRSDGSDSNDGLTNTAGGAFLTIQKALDTVANGLDLAGYAVTIQVAAGTYTGNISVPAPWVGTGNVILLGDATTPSNCLLSTSGGAIVVGTAASATAGSGAARLLLGGFKITTSGNGTAISVNESSLVSLIGAMEFGNVGTGSHLFSARGSGIYVNANYTISGNAGQHWNANTNSRIFCTSRTVTLSGSPVFSNGFARALRQGQIVCGGSTFSGSTGASSLRYALLTQSLIDTSGGGATYLPGDTAGSNDGTGVYA